jgi:hypothetical protein
MKSLYVKQLRNILQSEYYKTCDIEHLEQALKSTQHNIISSKEVLDAEDHALISNVNQMIDYYKYGHIIPIEDIDACVLAGHIPSIIYRIAQATTRPMSNDVESHVRSAIEKIFKSGDERKISRLSGILNYSYINLNPLQLSEKQADSFVSAAASYEEINTISSVRFGNTDIDTYNFSTDEWKEMVSVLMVSVRNVLLNEFKDGTFTQINKKMAIATIRNLDNISYLAVFFRNINIAEINLNTNREHPFEELLNICLEIRTHLEELDKNLMEVINGVEFLSELKEVNPNVNWLDLPKNRFGIRSLLFSEKKSEDSTFDLLDEA